MNTPIMQLREKRRTILLILATAIFLALAINFSTSFLSALFSDYPMSLAYSSAACFIIGLLLLKRTAFGDTGYVVRIRGAIAYSVKQERIERIRIYGYSFNDDFCRYLRAFAHENKAYLKLLSDKEPNTISKERFDPDDLNHYTIINSVIEFMVLSLLNRHLNSYFVHNEIDRNKIITLTRDQIDTKVLKNRVLDQLTKDMKERSVFSGGPESDSENVVYYSQSKDGSIYERFDMELPPRSKITRNNLGYIVINNPVFNLTIIPDYQGFGTYLPDIFLSSKGDHQSPLLVSLKMKIRIKESAVLAGGSMEMYEWLDSLVERMHDYMSTNRLKQRLDADLIRLLAPKTKERNPVQGPDGDATAPEYISVIAKSSDVDC